MNMELINLYNDAAQLYDGRAFFDFGEAVSDAHRKNEITDAEKDHLMKVVRVTSNALTEYGYCYEIFDILDTVEEICNSTDASPSEKEVKRIMNSKISISCLVSLAISIVSRGDTPIQTIKEYLINRYPELNNWCLGEDDNEILFGYYFEDDTQFEEYDIIKTVEEIGKDIDFYIFDVDSMTLIGRKY